MISGIVTLVQGQEAYARIKGEEVARTLPYTIPKGMSVAINDVVAIDSVDGKNMIVQVY